MPEPKPTRTRWLTALLVGFVLLELIISALQYYQMPLDGDVAAIVVPSDHYRQVLTDPFGLGACQGAVYAAPNRYFAHRTMGLWCRYVPLKLQAIGLAPIPSVYAAMALFKTLTQTLLLGLLAAYAAGTLDLRRRSFWLAAALIAPLFQTLGYQAQMGIIDRAPTYVFFCAWPLLLLLAFLWPFYRAVRMSEPMRWTWPGGLILFLAIPILTLNGALVTGVVSVLLPGIALAWLQKHCPTTVGDEKTRLQSLLARLPLLPVLFLGCLGLATAYSLWIGRNNLETVGNPLPVAERYGRLLAGAGNLLTAKLGLPLLLVGCAANAWWVRQRAAEPHGRWWRRAGGWVAAFSIAYLLLLPLGGYRSYRAFILRYDTALPITLTLAMYGAGTAAYLLSVAPTKRWRTWYGAGLVVFALIFANADKRIQLRTEESNAAERAALEQLAAATTPVVVLPPQVALMAWGPIGGPEWSATNAELIYWWRITRRPVRYYAAPNR